TCPTASSPGTRAAAKRSACLAPNVVPMTTTSIPPISTTTSVTAAIATAAMRRGLLMSKVGPEAQMQLGRAVRPVERPRDVEAHRSQRREPARADPGARARLEAAVEERVARVDEYRGRPVLAQRMLVLDARLDEAVAADQIAELVPRAERLIAIAAHAVVAACEEAHRQRHEAERPVLEQGAEPSAHDHARVPWHCGNPFSAKVPAQQRDLGAETAAQHEAQAMALARPREIVAVAAQPRDAGNQHAARERVVRDLVALEQHVDEARRRQVLARLRAMHAELRGRADSCDIVLAREPQPVAAPVALRVRHRHAVLDRGRLPDLRERRLRVQLMARAVAPVVVVRQPNAGTVVGPAAAPDRVAC